MVVNKCLPLLENDNLNFVSQIVEVFYDQDQC